MSDRLTLEDVRNRIVETRRMKLSTPLPNRSNWRQHPDSQRAAFRGVARQIGWAGVPMAYYSERNDGKLTYIDGHMREEELPDFEADIAITDLNDAEADLLLMTYDPISAMAAADREKLGALMQQVQTGEAGLQAMLAEMAEREGLYFGANGDGHEDAGPQIDKAAELQEKWQVKAGDVWIIPSRTAQGEHRIICGDCTDAAIVRQAIEGAPDEVAVITDPPYAFGLSSSYKLAVKSGGWHDLMNNASWFADRYNQWRGTFKKGPFWVFSNWRTLPILMKAAYDARIGIESVMVWYKDWIGPGGQMGLRPTYELIVLSISGGYGIPDRGIQDFIKVPWSSHKPNDHTSEKPADLLVHLIRVSNCQVNFDPFLGSGTTLVACERVGRLGRGIEIEPKYCAVALERLMQMGLEARLVTP